MPLPLSRNPERITALNHPLVDSARELIGRACDFKKVLPFVLAEDIVLDIPHGDSANLFRGVHVYRQPIENGKTCVTVDRPRLFRRDHKRSVIEVEHNLLLGGIDAIIVKQARRPSHSRTQGDRELKITWHETIGGQGMGVLKALGILRSVRSAGRATTSSHTAS